jgi:hypothetical protein
MQVNGAGSEDRPDHDAASGRRRGLSRSSRIRNSREVEWAREAASAESCPRIADCIKAERELVFVRREAV